MGHAIRGIYFFNPAPGFVGTFTFSYKACYESNNGICSQTATVTINAVNQAPVVIDDFMIVRSTTPASLPRGSVRYIENDYDPDGDELTAGGAVPQPSPRVYGDFGDGAIFGSKGFVSYGNGGGYEEFFYKLQDNLGMFSGIATITAFVYPIDGAEDAGAACPVQLAGNKSGKPLMQLESLSM